jgi:hypothetical protein
VSEGPARSNPVAYDLGDLIALSKLVPRKGIHALQIAAGAVAIMLALTLVVQAWAITGYFDWSAFGAGLLVASLILVISNRRFRAWSWLRLAKRSPLYAPHTFELVAGALRVSSPRLSSEIPWTTLHDVRLADGRLFAFMTKRLAYIIPRRAFDSDADFEAFAAAAREAWEQRHRL